MKNRPFLIIAFAGAIIVWSLYQSLGGIEGIQRDPTVSLGVIGIVVLISVPFFWFRYRRLQREPIYEPVRDPEPTAPPDSQLDSTPLLLVASRLKILGLLFLSVLAFLAVALMLWTQPGVCGVVESPRQHRLLYSHWQWASSVWWSLSVWRSRPKV